MENSIGATGFHSHQGEVLVVDAEVRESRLQSKSLEEESFEGLDSGFGTLHHGQRHVNVHHVHTEAADVGSGLLVEDVRKPARSEYGQAMTVGNVVEGRQLMFH